MADNERPARRSPRPSLITAVLRQEFKSDLSLAMSMRAAVVLARAAEKYPKETLPLSLLYLACSNETRTRPETDLAVQSMKNCLQRANEKLIEHYNKTVVREETGVRASVNEEEFATHAIVRTTQRIANAQATLTVRLQRVDPAKLTGPLREHVQNARRFNKMMIEGGWQSRLRLADKSQDKAK